MTRNLGVIVLGILFLSAFSFAVEVEQFPNSQTPLTEQASIETSLQILQQRVVSLENSLQNVPTKDYLDKKVNDLASYLTILDRDSKDYVIIILVITNLLQLGLAFGIFFYLKSIGRL